ncbi:MAG TPA: hypothetical protein VFD47_05290 [Actinomycetota bacterium]|nr:hypothetical protein [Actinomycetota bacterium]
MVKSVRKPHHRSISVTAQESALLRRPRSLRHVLFWLSRFSIRLDARRRLFFERQRVI